MAKNYTPRKIQKNNEGRRIAIGDIHGCYDAFMGLLDKLKMTKQDQIFLLGDTIDRGRNSSLVLDKIIELQKDSYQLFPIKGNHEEKLLLAYDCGLEFFEEYLETYNSQDLLCGELEEYLKLVYHFDYCIELDDFILSHAGINEGNINPFTDLRGMFPNVNFQFDEAECLKKTQIHGHLVRTITEIENSVRNKEKRFSIDSGCYLNEEGMGYLTAIDLDLMKLYHQKR